MCNPTNEDKIDESLIVSKEINRFEKKLVELQNEIDKVRQNRKEEEEILDKLDKEFGSEIARIKKEFARIKERSYEETLEVSNKAKVDALKEVLPITDNYFRAKKVFEPINKDSGEGTIYDTYDKIFASDRRCHEIRQQNRCQPECNR
jgi:molecular chaperone GrpE (heat shock protein)